MLNDKKARELLNTIGFALADENVGNQVARREGVEAHQELLDFFDGGGGLVWHTGGDGCGTLPLPVGLGARSDLTAAEVAARARIEAAIPSIEDIPGLKLMPMRGI